MSVDVIPRKDETNRDPVHCPKFPTYFLGNVELVQNLRAQIFNMLEFW
jgi:hypothetical protein